MLESATTIRWLTHSPEGVPRLPAGSRTFTAAPPAIGGLLVRVDATVVDG